MDSSDGWLLFWEVFGYVATAIVMAGCIGEGIVDFTTCIKGRLKMRQFGRASLLVLTGLALEILAQVQVNRISGAQIAASSVEAETIRKEAAWRRLTKAQHDAIVAFARADGPHQIVCAAPLDPEAGMLAGDICSAFSDGGWQMSFESQVRSPTFGFFIFPAPADFRRQTLSESSLWMRWAQIRPKSFSGSETPGTTLKVLVGSKPPAK